METFGKKELYSLVIIVLGIFIVGIYSSYALPLNDATSADEIPAYSLETNNLGTYKIAANTMKNYDVLIKNNSTGSIKYQLYYQIITPSSIPSGLTVSKSSYSVNDSAGLISKNSSKIITITINNNSASEVTLKIGVAPGFTNSEITLSSGQNAIS